LTVDLHAEQIQGFFNIPVDELTAFSTLGHYFEQKTLRDLVVVATDLGIVTRARDRAAKLNAPLAVIEKRRIGNIDKTETLTVIGDVAGMQALLVDDEVDTAGSLLAASSALKEYGAKEIYACCTHPILSGPAVSRIAQSPIKELVVTDTIPVPEEKKINKITVLSIAPLIGEAIYRIHNGLSVGAMFK
jgi:ribose-phosphate pyrophosphokinase